MLRKICLLTLTILILFSVKIFAAEVCEPPNGVGDWNVNTTVDQVCRNKDITLSGNLELDGNLTFAQNVTLRVNMTSSEQIRINLGNFTINTSNITRADFAGTYQFVFPCCAGRMYFRNSYISYIDGATQDGIQIIGAPTEFRNMTIYNSKIGLIIIPSAPRVVIMDNLTFINISDEAIRITGPNVNIRNVVIIGDGNSSGIRFAAGDYDNITLSSINFTNLSRAFLFSSVSPKTFIENITVQSSSAVAHFDLGSGNILSNITIRNLSLISTNYMSFDFNSTINTGNSNGYNITVINYTYGETRISFVASNVFLGKATFEPGDTEYEKSIGKYVNVSNRTSSSSYVNINFTWKESELGNMNEANMMIMKYDGSSWRNVSGSVTLDTTENTIRTNITNSDLETTSRVFAPMIIIPSSPPPPPQKKDDDGNTP